MLEINIGTSITFPHYQMYSQQCVEPGSKWSYPQSRLYLITITYAHVYAHMHMYMHICTYMHNYTYKKVQTLAIFFRGPFFFLSPVDIPWGFWNMMWTEILQLIFWHLALNMYNIQNEKLFTTFKYDFQQNLLFLFCCLITPRNLFCHFAIQLYNVQCKCVFLHFCDFVFLTQVFTLKSMVTNSS